MKYGARPDLSTRLLPLVVRQWLTHFFLQERIEELRLASPTSTKLPP